jgi:hypothetical protein
METAISILVIFREKPNNTGAVTMCDLGERNVVRDGIADHCVQRGGPACCEEKATSEQVSGDNVNGVNRATHCLHRYCLDFSQSLRSR